MSNVDISNITAEQRARILREERDLVALAGGDPRFVDHMNARINALGVDTMTGDTTEEN